MPSSSFRPLLIPLTVLVVLAASGCTKEKRVGVVLPLTGEHAVYGEESRKGIEMARDELLATDGDGKILLSFADSGSDPEAAEQRLGELYDDGAVAAIGGLTAEAVTAMAPVAEDRERVLLAPSANLGAHAANARHVYSLAPSDLTVGSTLGSFIARELSVKTAVLVGDRACFSQGLEEGFRGALETQGAQLTATVTAPESAQALAGALAEAVAAKPDAVFLAGYEPDVGAWIHELRRQGYKGKILTTQAFASPESIHRAGAEAAGVLVSHTAFAADEDERVAGFVERYRKRYGEEPGIYAAEGYDAFRVLAAALAGRPPLASEVRKGLIHEVKDFPGVTGVLQFDEMGGVHKIPRIYSIADDLTLRDHGKWMQAERDRILKQLAALKEKASSG